MGNRIFTTQELHQLGLSRSAIATKIKHGALYRVERGIYTEEKPEGILLLKALQRSRPGLIFSGRTAMQVHMSAEIETPVEAVIIKSRSACSNDVIRIKHVRSVASELRQGVRVASPLNVLNNAEAMPIAECVDFIEKTYWGKSGSARLIRDISRTRLSKHAHRVIELAAVGAESPAEIRLFRKLRSMGYPFEQNLKIGAYRWDGVHTKSKVIVEVDGYTYHGNRHAFVYDRWKGNEAVRRGYTLVRYSAWCIFECLDQVAGQIVALVGARLRGGQTPLLAFEKTPVWDWHPLLG
ncbi:type IV toxin-antitoxin system AbiEi family antitoxin domain-containing protein [Corynebacterium pseudotuberculosis]|uniref:DUF559 domain-containing protein n=1 Tax=Corynebacterium pseudotuberculosis (strain C231) TaxID=681645 RepID=D9QCC1_CORP2|nr:type IV toxin-antitoxin system AbiEi family antitoxin domain-containing protein [Corynebacterium pseudotuberculosis]AER69755.1 Hypothetical protein Cp106_1704 [Corynebacterium pseudotuberculosis 1/06-A]ADK29540.1 DUF559 domain-containing protein [Corynebacterium pseudotuberculosis FRC41]ADL11197.1 DUF559 domain-containing protein [Corynebacterium pseudotuberculosis C231]ADL21612.1 DUF559 domain-containing protein [Corynebacterium pseudotuberculosis 1002]AEK93070.1 Hypothetical protein CpPAT